MLNLFERDFVTPHLLQLYDSAFAHHSGAP